MKAKQQQDMQRNKSIAFRLGRGAMVGFSKLLIVPGMKKLCKHTFLGACSYVNDLTVRNRSREALDHLISLLDSDKFTQDKSYRWWYLMRQAISITQDIQLEGDNPPNAQVEHLLQLADKAPMPYQGYDAAYSFIGLALWSFQRGDSARAIFFVRHAISADKDWGYPEYLMGWLALFEKDIDPIPHFVNALKFNWSFFHRINKDPVCQQHPDVIRKVRQQVLMSTNLQVPSNTL